MPAYVNILYLSDLHFGMEPDSKISPTAVAHRNNALDPLVARVASLDETWRPEIICASGDIAWRGAATDYDGAGKFFAKLLEALALSADRLMLCPGNHDIARTATSGLGRPTSSKEADNWLRLEHLTTHLIGPFSAYTDFCKQFGIPLLRIGTNEHALIGYRDLLGLRLVSLNTAWFSRDDEDKNKLWIGLPQIELMHSHGQLADPDRYDEGPITIALLHHPHHHLHEAENSAYGDRPATYRYLAERVHLILSGHVHGAIEKANRHHHAAFVITGGATYAESTYRNNFSILQIALEERRVHRRSFEFDPRFGKWIEREGEGEGKGEEFSLRRHAHHSTQQFSSRLPAAKNIRFATERLVNQMDLQRVVHAAAIDENLSVDFIHDTNIQALLARLDRRYDNFDDEMGATDCNSEDLDFLKQAIDAGREVLAGLPRTLVLFVQRLLQEGLLGRRHIAKASSRLIELTMTGLLARLSRYQTHSDVPIYFGDYPHLAGLDAYVAKIDGRPTDTIFTYRIMSVGSFREASIFAPIDYGPYPGWLAKDCDEKRKPKEPYIPPISFLTDYLLPQIAYQNWSATEKWDLSGRCTSIFIKDREDHYWSPYTERQKDS